MAYSHISSSNDDPNLTEVTAAPAAASVTVGIWSPGFCLPQKCKSAERSQDYKLLLTVPLPRRSLTNNKNNHCLIRSHASGHTFDAEGPRTVMFSSSNPQPTGEKTKAEAVRLQNGGMVGGVCRTMQDSGD